MITSSEVKELAIEVGFDLVGITRPDIIPAALARYHQWIKRGFHADMEWMATSLDRRSDPSSLMDETKSIIILGVNYYQANSETIPNGFGRVSRYARGRDYHKIIGRMIKSLLKKIEYAINREVIRQQDIACCFKWCVDYGPFLERSYAEKAGLGFIGKNGMLINKTFGSWILLAEIVTSIELTPDHIWAGDHGRCGTCRRCIDACPTGAILEDGIIDARRCLSYLTVEHRGDIDDELATKAGDRLFGCDTCQEVCPHNQKRAVLTNHRQFLPESGVGEFVDVHKVQSISTQEDFLALTAGTSLVRSKLEGLRRNAQIVLRNTGNLTR